MDDETIRRILRETRTIAVVGWSPNPARPSHGVAVFLKAAGYRVIPVNPGQAGREALGEVVRADLAALADEGVDMIDIFRRSEHVPEVVRQALEHLPDLRTVWMQLGVTSAGAAEMAEAKGIAVVQDRCPAIEIPRLGL
ncbi:CoA-binding protein [Cereibacter sphaeroides]|uniref:CoA-binding protein n=1 Tax=Cereibacter sphaeroides TaxID=1063 RepID=UPI001F2C9081|nr:CoA-binding protein [Cereibacter sphaeroides]MCE6961331.1 CoA-binding protein [Cereibacter sphaeroides]MCE6970317.1 CoA-binding protein [Cereibacter sphaeroides]MCE6973988.1 CoA-binding protein [Cereibacter sphaeroides]